MKYTRLIIILGLAFLCGCATVKDGGLTKYGWFVDRFGNQIGDFSEVEKQLDAPVGDVDESIDPYSVGVVFSLPSAPPIDPSGIEYDSQHIPLTWLPSEVAWCKNEGASVTRFDQWPDYEEVVIPEGVFGGGRSGQQKMVRVMRDWDAGRRNFIVRDYWRGDLLIFGKYKDYGVMIDE